MKPTTATPAQLRSFLKWAIRYVQRENDWHRKKPPCERKAQSAVQIGKTDMWLAKVRKAVKAKGRA
jgi:hypothetical protein